MAEQLAILSLELSHFMILSVILLQYSAIFTILLSHFVFFYNKLTQFSLLQYSAISPCYHAYPLCYSAHIFCYIAQPVFTVLGHFMILLAIFHCYSTHPFSIATVLNRFPVLQCSVIYDPVSHFRVVWTVSGPREGTRLNCVWAHDSIGYACRTKPRV
jgi:hypothetical protein